MIAPHPSDLDWAHGTVPTPLGQIDVDWERSEQRFVLNVNAPETMALKIILPIAARRVEINGQVVWEEEQTSDASHGWSIEQANGEIHLSLVQGGSYLIVAQ